METVPPEIVELMHEEDGFCHPDWAGIGKWIESKIPEADGHDLWTEIARKWVGRLRARLGGNYRLHETQNFLFLADAPDRILGDIAVLSERALQEILGFLPGLASDAGYGPHVVLLFGNLDHYYGYTSLFQPEGEHPMSGGCALDLGYSHLAIPLTREEGNQGPLVHELTHVCLGHLPIPAWLNEALAMRMENALCGSFPLNLDREEYQKHAELWNPVTIQQFWSGESWTIQGDLFELSYPLAQVIWRKIEIDTGAPREAIFDFVEQADCTDGGEKASQSVFGLSLGEFVADFLGDGDWSPQPEQWPAPETISVLPD